MFNVSFKLGFAYKGSGSCLPKARLTLSCFAVEENTQRKVIVGNPVQIDAKADSFRNTRIVNGNGYHQLESTAGGEIICQGGLTCIVLGNGNYKVRVLKLSRVPVSTS